MSHTHRCHYKNQSYLIVYLSFAIFHLIFIRIYNATLMARAKLELS